MSIAAWEFCQHSLVEVSRSFALIIPECPEPIDRALCIAYLLCRIADTIEDEPGLSSSQQAVLYDTFLASVDDPDNSCLLERFLASWPQMTFSEPGYGELVRGTGQVLTVYRELPAELIKPIAQCVHEMVDGMRQVATVETREGIRFFCRDLPDLDRYCHIVAGTVGVMSTALFEWRLGQRGDRTGTPAWREQGRRLGLGLQMTNIIKDCRVDAERGVSFIPAAFVNMRDGSYVLADSTRRQVFEHAVAHLDAGFEYTMAIGREETGIRRFLLGSLLPAIATLEVAAKGDAHHPKIDRAKMTEILELITDEAVTDSDLREWYGRHREGTLNNCEQ